MSHHAYLVTGDIETGIEAAKRSVKKTYGVEIEGNRDVNVLRYGLFSVEDARTISSLALRHPVKGDLNIIIIGASRFFHEAQNALLKLFEEPPASTRLFLVVPSEGNIIPTLRSRLILLTDDTKKKVYAPILEEFLAGSVAVREKLIAKLLDQAKSDNDTEKAKARENAVLLLEGLMHAVYEKHGEKSNLDTLAFLDDLDRFIPILHERSAPLKPIFEHLLITIPRGLTI